MRALLPSLVLGLAIALAGSSAAAPGPPRLLALRITNGDTPFAGDTPQLTTVSPNGDGFRDRAVIRFSLDQPASVQVQAVATGGAGEDDVPIWRTRRSFGTGPHSITWAPRRSAPDRTYLLRFIVHGRQGGRRVYGYEAPRPGHRTSGLVVRVQSVEAGFLLRSYPVGAAATVSIATDARSVRLQVFSLASVLHPTTRDLRTRGSALAPPVTLDWRRHRDAPSLVKVGTAGDWETGLYLLRVTTGDGRVGVAPLILRPRTLGAHRVAVVFPTNTWQAYNRLDQDGDGWGNSWYVNDAIRSVDLRRPYLDFGVASTYHDWSLDVVSWLQRTGKEVDYLSDDDLGHARSADALRRAYTMIVFPAHEEYVTQRQLALLRSYRDLGGRLMFLSANNLLWKVTRSGQFERRVQMWRKLGRAEAGLVGAQWAGSGTRRTQAPFVVQGAVAAPWAFAGTGLANGAAFGRFGIEVDARTRSSPPGTIVLARIARLVGGKDAEMTYYETPTGARVFSAGAVNFASAIGVPAVSRLLENVWARLLGP